MLMHLDMGLAKSAVVYGVVVRVQVELTLTRTPPPSLNQITSAASNNPTIPSIPDDRCSCFPRQPRLDSTQLNSTLVNEHILHTPFPLRAKLNSKEQDTNSQPASQPRQSRRHDTTRHNTITLQATPPRLPVLLHPPLPPNSHGSILRLEFACCNICPSYPIPFHPITSFPYPKSLSQLNSKLCEAVVHAWLLVYLFTSRLTLPLRSDSGYIQHPFRSSRTNR